MKPTRFNRVMQGQLDALRREELIDAETHQRLIGHYPTTHWNWLSLGRWLLLFGIVSIAIGLFFIGQQLFEFTLTKAAVLCCIATVGAFYGACDLRRRGLIWASRSLEVLAGLLIIGLSFLLGAIFSSGSGNWPALLLVDMLILLPLAYARNNVLLLVLTVLVFFTWFGGVTGYSSGWGAYWFGMNYPLRFLLAGLAIATVGVIHRLWEHGPLAPYRGFFKVWLSAGVFFGEMALWLMSLFGNFGSIWGGHQESAAELVLFNALWAAGNVALLYLGSRYGLRMLRGYAVTFFVIQAYTIFFWQIAGNIGPVLSTFIAGSVTLALVTQLERWRRTRHAPTPLPSSTAPTQNIDIS